MSEVRWEMCTWYKTLAILSSIYQKSLNLMNIWRSSDRNSLCSFFRHGVYTYYIQEEKKQQRSSSRSDMMKDEEGWTVDSPIRDNGRPIRVYVYMKCYGFHLAMVLHFGQLVIGYQPDSTLSLDRLILQCPLTAYVFRSIAELDNRPRTVVKMRWDESKYDDTMHMTRYTGATREKN